MQQFHFQTSIAIIFAISLTVLFLFLFGELHEQFTSKGSLRSMQILFNHLVLTLFSSYAL